MTLHITDHRDGFDYGLTTITKHDDAQDNTGIALSIMRLKKAEVRTLTSQNELALLLMQGNVKVSFGTDNLEFERNSLFDESASCIHIPAGTEVEIQCVSEAEFTLYECQNQQHFPAEIYYPEQVPNEHRGKGQVGDRCLRYVRTIFDRTNSSENAELVLGEVVTFPGGWSSYPPHHHSQPEIYHYRFTKPQGYGHAELGEEVMKVKHYDTVKILDGYDHAQCAAPGYGMYYSWVIRHLPDNPYTVPEFTAEHTWSMAPDADYWQPAHDLDEQ